LIEQPNADLLISMVEGVIDIDGDKKINLELCICGRSTIVRLTKFFQDRVEMEF
jgi:hypothetical protein